MRPMVIGALLGAIAGLTVAAAGWIELRFELWNEAGRYLKQDDRRALPLFVTLARRGDRTAAAVLTDIYVKDDLVPHDDERALYWADRADRPVETARGHAKALMVGNDGLPRDPARAALWLAHARSSQASRQ